MPEPPTNVSVDVEDVVGERSGDRNALLVWVEDLPVDLMLLEPWPPVRNGVARRLALGYPLGVRKDGTRGVQSDEFSTSALKPLNEIHRPRRSDALAEALRGSNESSHRRTEWIRPRPIEHAHVPDNPRALHQ